MLGPAPPVVRTHTFAVPQETLVLKVPPHQHSALRARLAAGSFEWREVPHALFSIRGEGAVVTLYRSGKLVVQAPDPALFLARHTDLDAGDAAPARPARAHEPADDSIVDLNEPLVGSDETGKGDYFGPLVVAAARVEPAQVAELSAAGIADSKKLSDVRALRLAAMLRDKVDHVIHRLDPPEYNRTHAEVKNLNPVLARLHARAIAEVAKPGDRVLVDQFANERVMREALEGVDVRLHQAHRAERNLAVAAASILARAEFLLALDELSKAYDVELRKGAGAPTDAAGVEFVGQHGQAALEQVAKCHFKNTAKILARVR